MRISFKLSFAAASLAAAMVVSAQPAPASDTTAAPSNNPMQPWAGQRGGMRRQPLTAEQRQARLDHAIAQQAQTLQITAAQRPQWDAYVQSRKNMHNAMSARRDALYKQDLTSMTAEQRAEARARHMETAAQHARQIAGNTKALRNVLTPEQRTRFDQMPAFGVRFQGSPRGAKHQWNKQTAPMNQPTAPASQR